jgi:hypothetical protein
MRGGDVFLESIYGPIESELKSYTQTFLLAPELWQKFHFDGVDNVDFTKWKRVKMMDEDGNLSEETKKNTLLVWWNICSKHYSRCYS